MNSMYSGSTQLFMDQHLRGRDNILDALIGLTNQVNTLRSYTCDIKIIRMVLSFMYVYFLKVIMLGFLFFTSKIYK